MCDVASRTEIAVSRIDNLRLRRNAVVQRRKIISIVRARTRTAACRHFYVAPLRGRYLCFIVELDLLGGTQSSRSNRYDLPLLLVCVALFTPGLSPRAIKTASRFVFAPS